MPARLGVNIDHVATLRQARGTHEPEPVMAALLAQSAGAHGITIHLRSDRRHIQERDARLLKEVLTIPLTIKSAATADGLEAAVPVNPAWVALVPETREEPTTQGGLDVIFLHAHLRQLIRELHASQIRVSLFVDAQPDQLKSGAGRSAQSGGGVLIEHNVFRSAVEEETERGSAVDPNLEEHSHRWGLGRDERIQLERVVAGVGGEGSHGGEQEGPGDACGSHCVTNT